MGDDVLNAARRIKRVREQRGWSAEKLAQLTRDRAAAEGVSLALKQQSISTFENEHGKRLPGWYRYVEMVLEDVLAGIDPEAPPIPFQEDDSVQVERLPTFAGAGGGGTGDGDGATVSFSRDLIEREIRARPSDLLAVVIEGNSMMPDFQSGDQLLVDKRRQSVAQPGAFCLWDGDGYVVKYLERLPDSDPPKLRVISRNEIYSAHDRLAEEVRIMGRVIWFGRRV